MSNEKPPDDEGLPGTENTHAQPGRYQPMSEKEKQAKREAECIVDLIECLEKGINEIELSEVRRRNQNLQPFLRTENDNQYHQQLIRAVGPQATNRLRALDEARKILQTMLQDIRRPPKRDQVREDTEELSILIEQLAMLWKNLRSIAEKHAQSQGASDRLQGAMKAWMREIELTWSSMKTRLDLINDYLSY